MKIHYLQHVPFEGLASIESWAISQNHSLSATRFHSNEPLPSVKDIDWLIVMGGPMNIYEDDKYPWLTEEKRFIEQAIKQNKTVIGICLGSQLIANVLGAKIYQAQHKEIGWFPIQMTDMAKDSAVFNSLPQRLTVFHWHGDTFDLPESATRLAYSEGCQNQAFVYNQKVLGLQFHLESTKDSVQQIIENCADELVEGRYIQKPEEMLLGDGDFDTLNNAMSRILNNLSSGSAA
ncbi:type 1 glutamine amidotransferase [Thermocoleostomius sinensis]|uniref:Type 1 glutamine amidotransferase n=1 Tax=Thermocoleostomius sinensis A174 TaxID=2016057 RepID=A0A9E9CB64_9CYAN|nr:type 1 glutamine amidotransferase [Thermocoleostomius sinensis]WAL59900.1 type 1 glutamine amidotransferase [Thermocoleostomius sinensis A174]